MEHTINQHNIDCCSMAFNNLNLQYRTLAKVPNNNQVLALT